jgi:hypothetical protein
MTADPARLAALLAELLQNPDVPVLEGARRLLVESIKSALGVAWGAR